MTLQVCKNCDARFANLAEDDSYDLFVHPDNGCTDGDPVEVESLI